MLRGTALGGVGLATAALIGCGDDDDGDGGGGDGNEERIGGSTTADQAETTAEGVIQNPNLPYPHHFPEPDKEPVRGGKLTVGATWDVGILDPVKSAAGGTIVIPNMVYNRLIGYPGGPALDPFILHLEPELASSWEQSPDGLTHTFHLRPDINWQNVAPLNGRPFVAGDVKAAYERYAADGVHTTYWKDLDSMETPDDHTLVIRLAQPNPDFVVPLGSRYQTIFPPELVDSGEIESKAVGTGPLILKEAVPASYVTWERNPDYWERDVLLDEVEFKMMPDAAARVAAFRVGQLEYGYGIVSTLRDVEELQKTNPDIQINIPPKEGANSPLAINNRLEKFQDERVRRALALGVDRNTIIEVLYEGLGVTLPVMRWAFVFDEEPTDLGPWVTYDPEQAKQLLSAAGYEDGFDLNYIYYPYFTTYDRISELLVDQYRQVGINMKGGKVDYTEFNSQWVGAKLPEATTSGWATAGFDANNFFYNQLHSESPGNRWLINDPQIDEWAEAQSVELDADARRDILRKIWDRMLDQMYRPPLADGYFFEIYQPWLRGVRFGGALGSSSYYYDWGDQIAGAWIDESAR